MFVYINFFIYFNFSSGNAWQGCYNDYLESFLLFELLVIKKITENLKKYLSEIIIN